MTTMNCEKCFREYCDKYRLNEEEVSRLEKELAHNGQSICGTGKSFPCPQGYDKYSHGGYRPNAGRKPTGSKAPRCFRLDAEEYAKVKEFIKIMRSENKMTIEEIKQAAKDFSNNAERVDNCERLGYEGLIDEAKADEIAALSRLVKRIDEAGMTIEEAVKAAKLPWPIEKTLKNGGRW